MKTRSAILLLLSIACAAGALLVMSGRAHAAPSNPTIAPAGPQSVSLVTVGAGISPVAIRMSDGAIGVGSVSPAEIDFNLIQRPTNTTRLVVWRIGFGFNFSMAPGGSAKIGGYVIPWSMQYGSVAFGIGMGYEATGNAGAGWSHVSLLFPCSYSIDLMGGGQ